MLSVEYYSHYFDVDTDNVLERIQLALLPTGGFLDKLQERGPDLWGPFWVPTTLIFFCFFTSSLAAALAAYLSQKPYVYDYSLLSSAMSMVYSYIGIGSLAVWGAAKYLGSPVSWLEIVSVLGYGQSIWIPVSILTVLPQELLRWIFVFAGFAVSGYFVSSNLYVILNRNENVQAKMIVLAALGAHGIFALCLKIFFFSYSVEWPANP
jgi:hypothetical protein